MTAYIAITDAETDPEAPLTSELAKKWRDNPLALAEGDATAPVNQSMWHPYNKVTNGDTNTGLIWDGSVNPNITNTVFFETPNWVNGYEYRLRFEGLQVAGSGGLFVDIFAETDAVYNSTRQIINTTSGNHFLTVEFYRPRFVLSQIMVKVDFSAAIIAGTNATTALAASSVYCDGRATPQRRLRARLSVATFASRVIGGLIFMDRRLAL